MVPFTAAPKLVDSLSKNGLDRAFYPLHHLSPPPMKQPPAKSKIRSFGGGADPPGPFLVEIRHRPARLITEFGHRADIVVPSEEIELDVCLKGEEADNVDGREGTGKTEDLDTLPKFGFSGRSRLFESLFFSCLCKT
jgi:hypothetical protein